MRKTVAVIGVILLFGFENSRAAAACPGDCSGDDEVTVNELIQGVSIALGTAPISQCSSFDTDGNSNVTINELITAVNNALNGCGISLTGDYSGTLDLGGSRSGAIEMTVAATGQITGSLVVDAASLASRIFGAVSLPTGGFSVTLSGSANLAAGTFEISGSFVDGSGLAIPVNISGTLPGPTGSVSITARVGTETFSGTLSAAAATPTPTPITGGCSDGMLGVTFSNASVDTNADTSALTLGMVSALDQSDGTGSTFIWVITGSPCKTAIDQVTRGVVFQGVFMSNQIQPGTYAIGSSSPPFLSVTYTES